MIEVAVTTEATKHAEGIKYAELWSNHHQTNIQLFTGNVPFLSPNRVIALKGKSIQHQLASKYNYFCG